MDTTTKNKTIAAFMGITYYESYGACRDARLKLIEEIVPEGKSSAELIELTANIDATHQFSPEYHNSYDKMIPVVHKLRKSIYDTFGFCEFLSHFILKVENELWYSNKEGFFELLYETICHFNQFTKNMSNASPTQQIQQPDQAVQSRTHTGSDGSGTSNGITGIPQG